MADKMLKIAIIAVMAVFLALPLKNSKPEFSTMIIISGCLLILGCAVSKLGSIIEVVVSVKKYMGDEVVYLGILMKIIAITYIAEFGASICRDSGYSAIGNQVEFFGKLMILAVSMPIITTLLETISSIMGK
ncbi:stage III sporulation protein AD [Eubacterium sp. MSJ-13]|uniref:SpoIIIAC/SpoIIIAD family protein n=1 Tax=Eubacterium sp. MSJ-13 TaxID=2841513 RepID=UPI001C0F6849|nr:stage III sporulation protein AD [Eubacterium sp. MSJ-13]